MNGYFNSSPRLKELSLLGKLILIFVLVPLADLILLMQLSQYVGWPFSIAMVVLSGIIGAYLAKLSYRSVWKKFHTRSAGQQMPTDLLTDGAMIFFAAGLLLTPGFLTDAVGLSLLVPACRRWYKARILAWVKRNFKMQIVSMNPNQRGGDSDVVEGEVVRPKNSPSQPNSSERIEG